MPRVTHVKKAQKDYPNYGIKKGDPYYWWKFRHGGKIMSKTRPRPSQLTQSNFLSQAYEIQEDLADFEWGDDLQEIRDRVETLGEECQESMDNMPESLQYNSPTFELLEERQQACEDFLSHLDDLISDMPEIEDDTEPTEQKQMDDWVNEVQQSDGNFEI